MNVIETINAQRRLDVKLLRQKVSVEELTSSVHYHRSCYSLREALLSAGPVAVIAEHKQASPSEGAYGCPADVKSVVQGYAEAGAAAMSILTEPHRFGGSLDHLVQARELTSLPLLRKDFVVDPYQVHEAKSAGADAILLIAAGLSLDQAMNLSSLAHDLGLEVLLELHDESEFEYLVVNPDVLGINNRNLKTLKINIKSSIDLFDKIPDEYVKISESGIKSAEDAAGLLAHGYQGLLIGTQFMKTGNPGNACKLFLAATSMLLKAQNTQA